MMRVKAQHYANRQLFLDSMFKDIKNGKKLAVISLIDTDTESILNTLKQQYPEVKTLLVTHYGNDDKDSKYQVVVYAPETYAQVGFNTLYDTVYLLANPETFCPRECKTMFMESINNRGSICQFHFYVKNVGGKKPVDKTTIMKMLRDASPNKNTININGVEFQPDNWFVSVHVLNMIEANESWNNFNGVFTKLLSDLGVTVLKT